MLRALATSYRDAFSGLPRRVWLLALVTLVNRSGTMVLPFMSLYFTRELGFSPATAGVLLSVFGVGSVAGSLLGGWASDRLGAIRVQEASFLLTGVGFLVLMQLRTFPAVAAGIFAVSVVSEAFRPAIMSATALSSPPEIRTRSLAMIRLAANLGMSIGPAIGGVLATHRYAWLFVGDALTCWAAGLVLLVTLHPRRPLVADDVPQPPADAARSPWRDGPYLLFLVLMAGLAVTFFQVFSTFPIYLRDAYHLSEAGIGGLLATNAAVIVLVEMVILKKIEGLSPVRVMALGAVLICGGLAMLPMGSSLAFAVVCVLVWTLGEMLALPLANAVAANRAPAASSGRYLGAFTFSYSLAFILAPAAGTAIYQSLGPQVLWYGIGVCGLVLGAGYAALSPRLDPRSRTYPNPGGGE